MGADPHSAGPVFPSRNTRAVFVWCVAYPGCSNLRPRFLIPGGFRCNPREDFSERALRWGRILIPQVQSFPPDIQTRYFFPFLLDFNFFSGRGLPPTGFVCVATTLMHTEWTREPSRTTAVEIAKVPDRSRPTRCSGGPAVGV